MENVGGTTGEAINYELTPCPFTLQVNYCHQHSMLLISGLYLYDIEKGYIL